MICTHCKIDKSENAFARDATRKTNLFPWCRACKRADDIDRRTKYGETIKPRRHESYKRNSASIRKRVDGWTAAHKTDTIFIRKKRAVHLMAKYGITLEVYDAMLQKQEGSCLICRSTKRLCLDHDHSTRRIRAILCLRCNTLLGHIENDIGLIYKLIDYIWNRQEQTA